MLRGPGAFYTVADELRKAVLAKIPVVPGQPAPTRTYVTTGRVAWDQCDCGGQLAVSVLREWLTPTFPGEPGQGAGPLPPCDLAFRAAELVVSLMRCAPNPDDAGNVPAAALTASARDVVLPDGWTLQAGVSCRLQQLQDSYDISLFQAGAVTFVDHSGGCAGAEQRVTVALANVCPCEAT